MRRFSDENGVHASSRNWGRLALALIPAALGGAAILWLTAAFGWIDLTQELRMTDRTMQSVGISVMPRTPIQLINHDDACLKVESSYMDGDRLQFYTRNTCHRWLSLPNFSYRLKAHDGTVIGSERYAFSGDRRISPRERREQRVYLDEDNRIEIVELWMIDGQ